MIQCVCRCRSSPAMAESITLQLWIAFVNLVGNLNISCVASVKSMKCRRTFSLVPQQNLSRQFKLFCEDQDKFAGIKVFFVLNLNGPHDHDLGLSHRTTNASEWNNAAVLVASCIRYENPKRERSGIVRRFFFNWKKTHKKKTTTRTAQHSSWLLHVNGNHKGLWTSYFGYKICCFFTDFSGGGLHAFGLHIRAQAPQCSSTFLWKGIIYGKAIVTSVNSLQ